MNTQRPHIAVRHHQRGFTLLELIFVIVMIASIAAVVGGKLVSNKNRAQSKLTLTQLQSLAAQIDQYQSDVGSYPDSLDQLVTAPGNTAAWLGPYAKTTDFKDPWHNDIQYKHPGESDAPYQLISMGADGKSGGEGVDQDLTAP